MRLLSSLALLTGLPVLGQMNTGEISGSVQDPSGGRLPEATIVAEQAGTNQKFTTVSNRSGEYLFGQLAVGEYSITASALNFKQTTLTRLEVHAGDRLRRDFTLQIGDAREVVTVEAGVGSAQLGSAEIRDVIGRQHVVDLPLKGRQFLDLAMLSQGVVRPPGGTRGDAMQQAGSLVNSGTLASAGNASATTAANNVRGKWFMAHLLKTPASAYRSLVR